MLAMHNDKIKSISFIMVSKNIKYLGQITQKISILKTTTCSLKKLKNT